MHIFYKGHLPNNLHLNYMDIQIFSDQYIALTGDGALNFCPEINGGADVYAFLASLPRSSIVATFEELDDARERATDNMILDRMISLNSGTNARRIRQLWKGQRDRNGDKSSEDFELLNALESFSGNKEQVKRLFLMSGLARDLDRKGNHAMRYVERSIVRAFNKKAKAAVHSFFRKMAAPKFQV